MRFNKYISWLLYLAAAFTLSYPFLKYPYLFLADQYVHGYNACVLQELISNPDSFYASWFKINTFPEPNWIGHAIMLALGTLFPIAVVEKVFVGILVVGNGLAFLSTRNPLNLAEGSKSSWPWKIACALFSLIILFGAIWQLGFVNYLIGMVAVIAGLTFTSYRSTDNPYAVIAWSTLIYFSHPVAFLFFLGTYSLRLLLKENLISTYFKPLKGDWGSFIKHTAMGFGFPMFLLVAYILTHSEMSTLKGASPFRLLSLVFYHEEISLFNAGELPWAQLAIIALVITIGIGLLVIWKHQRARMLTLTGAGVLLSAVILAPDYFAGGALIHQRLMPMVFIWTVWCIAFVDGQALISGFKLQRIAVPLMLVAVICTVALTHYRDQSLPAIAKELDDFRVFSEQIPSGSTVLPVSGSANGIRPGQDMALKPVFHHFAATIDCSRDIVLLDNYEAFVGYFPLLWQEGKDPFLACTRGLEEHPARIDASSKQWFLQNVDYLLSAGPIEESLTPETYEWLKESFGDRYHSGKGNFQLIRVNDIERSTSLY